MDEAAVGRARLLRRHRRPRLQEDLSRAAGDGARAASSTSRSSAWRKSGWTREQLVERARASVTEHGGLDAEAFAKLVDAAPLRRRRLQRSRRRSRKLQGGARGRAAPGALPRHPAEHVPTVVEQPRRRPAARPTRASSSRSRSGATWRPRSELNEMLHECLPRGGDLPHRSLPRQGGGAEHPLLPLRQRVPRADLEPPLRRERADHDGRELRREGPRQVLRGDRRHPRRHPEPPAADRELPGDGGAVVARTPRRSATSRPRCCARCGR